MKIEIENYIFVADAFGPIPMWSIQHPKGAANGAYALMPEGKTIMQQDERSVRVRDLFRRINETFPYCEVYVSGELEYEVLKNEVGGGDDKTLFVVDIKVEKITLYPSESGRI